VERLGAPVFAPPPDSQEDLMDKYDVTAEEAFGGSPDLAWLLAGDPGEAHLYSAGDRLPVGVEAFPGREPNDLVLWIENRGRRRRHELVLPTHGAPTDRAALERALA
jgi:hypothetical protein